MTQYMIAFDDGAMTFRGFSTSLSREKTSRIIEGAN